MEYKFPVLCAVVIDPFVATTQSDIAAHSDANRVATIVTGTLVDLWRCESSAHAARGPLKTWSTGNRVSQGTTRG